MNSHRTFSRAALGLAAIVCVYSWSTTAGAGEEKQDRAPGKATTIERRHPAPDPKPPQGPSLYERLGGVNTIAVLVDDVVERSYVSEVFNANPRIAEAHKRFPKPVYKFNATALVCMVTGGPQKYTGRSLKEAHQHLRATEKEWQELVKMIRDSMNYLKVPEKEQDEVIAIVESTKGDVVPSAKAEK